MSLAHVVNAVRSFTGIYIYIYIYTRKREDDSYIPRDSPRRTENGSEWTRRVRIYTELFIILTIIILKTLDESGESLRRDVVPPH